MQDKLNYVLELNSYAYDQTQLKNLTQYLETTSSGDNSNFGKVNIHSKQSQVGWGELGPFIESDRIPSITQIGQETAEIIIDYMVGAENDNNSYDTYRVKDYYKIPAVNCICSIMSVRQGSILTVRMIFCHPPKLIWVYSRIRM